MKVVKGYDIEFNRGRPINYTFSKPFHQRLNESDESTLERKIQKLLEKGVLENVDHVPNEFISTVFFRPKPDGSSHMILNL